MKKKTIELGNNVTAEVHNFMDELELIRIVAYVPRAEKQDKKLQAVWVSKEQLELLISKIQD